MNVTVLLFPTLLVTELSKSYWHSAVLKACAFFMPKNFRIPIDNYFAMIQLMAGGGVALIGITLVPLLSGLFG